MTAPLAIGFLFNHDAGHQIAHTAPIIAALAGEAGVVVTVLASSPAQEDAVRALLPEAAAGRVRFVQLDVGPWAARIDRLARWIAPFRRVAVLKENLARFAALDALVVPETTSAFLRTRFGLVKPALIYLPHGAGDRSVGFRPVTAVFDLVLLSGRKVRDRMLAGGLIRDGHHAIVGYPKFDTVDLDARPRLFADDRPVVLYNPHFDPRLSSWWTMGDGVLDWFARQDRFNLIVAPHVMLFQRRVHASVEHRRLRWRGDIPARFPGLPNILVDTGSARSVDMTYTRAADIYLGDASSQIYEWIARPRPAIFLNSHGAQWRDDPSYAHWRLGEVVDDVAGLPAALDRAMADPAAFADGQRAAFADTFSLTDVPSARRAAEAILAYLRQGDG